MVAHPLVALRSAIAGEYIESDLEPVGEALGDFESFMEGVLVRPDSVHGGLRPFEREIGMQLEHRVTGRNKLTAIHLHFIVALCEQSATATRKRQQRSENRQTRPRPDFSQNRSVT
jgi:hypothetical protein